MDLRLSFIRDFETLADLKDFYKRKKRIIEGSPEFTDSEKRNLIKLLNELYNKKKKFLALMQQQENSQ